MTTAYVRTMGEILKEFNAAPDTGLNSAQVIPQEGAIRSEPSHSGHRKNFLNILAALANNVIVYLFAAGCRGQPDTLLPGPVEHFLRRYWIAWQRKLRENQMRNWLK